MCRYCPPGSIVCLEPADERPARCAFCDERDAAEDLVATAAMAAHAAVREGDRLCAACHRDIDDDLPRVTCALCGRAEHPDRVDLVDLLGGAAVAVCHPCELALERDAAEAAADRQRDAWIAALEATFELAGPLPTDPDWQPANDAVDPGEAA